MTKGFTIINPKHKKYNFGTLYFEFLEKDEHFLKNIWFVIDNNKFFVSMVLMRGALQPTWIFQKENNFHTLNIYELEKITALTEDVLENFSFHSKATKLLKKIKPQAELYLKLSNKNLSQEERKKIRKEFRSQKQVIIDFNTYQKQLLEKEKEIN